MYLSTLLLLFPAISTASLTITIPPSTILPNPNSLPPSTHASLTSLSNPNANSNYPLTAPLTRSSTFNFPKVDSASTPESFLLDIRSPGYVFAPFRVDVASDGSILGVWETFRGNSWDNRGPEKFVADSDSAGRKEVTVSAKVVARRKFFEERATCTSFLSGFSWARSPGG